MNLKKTKAISSEIFLLLKEIYTHRNPSSLEKDLLKEKLRAMYEAIDDEQEVSEEESLSEQNPNNQDFVPFQKDPEPIVSPEIPSNHSTSEEENPVKSTSKFTFLNQEEEPESHSNGISNPTVHQDDHSSVAPEKQEQDIGQSEREYNSVTKDQTKIAEEVDAEIDFNGRGLEEEESEMKLEELFTFQEVKELSDKLSQSPITDLTKAMGINDRLLTVNELFGGDYGSFEDSFRKINNMDSFDEAKAFLVDQVVVKHNWIDPAKKDRARQFIRFVRRRYING